MNSFNKINQLNAYGKPFEKSGSDENTKQNDLSVLLSGKYNNNQSIKTDSFDKRLTDVLEKHRPKVKKKKIRQRFVKKDDNLIEYTFPEKKSIMEQYNDKPVPEDFCVIIKNDRGEEQIILGDCAGPSDKDPEKWFFINAENREPMLINHQDIHNIQPDTLTKNNKIYYILEKDKNGNHIEHKGLVPKILNGRCFFLSNLNDNLMLLDNSIVFEKQSKQSIAELIIDKKRKEKSEKHRQDLLDNLDAIVFSAPILTKRERFIQNGKTKEWIMEQKAQDEMITDQMADYFLTKTLSQLQEWEKVDFFRFFARDDRQEYNYERICRRLEKINLEWNNYREKFRELSAIKNQMTSFSSTMEQNREYYEKDKKLEFRRQKILGQMNFVKRQINKLDFIKIIDQRLAQGLHDTSLKSGQKILERMTTEEKTILARYIQPKIGFRHSTREFKDYLEGNFDKIINEIKLVRRLNRGEFWPVAREMWSGFVESWDRFDEKLSDILNRPLFISRSSTLNNKQSWWQKIKGWFKG